LRQKINVPATAPAMEAILEGLVRLNQVALRAAKLRGKPFPNLYGSGVKYDTKVGFTQWMTAAEILAAKAGICSGLSAWRAAELREQGRPARVIVRPSLSGMPGRWHAMVLRDIGIEDPSYRTGMKINNVARAKLVNAKLLRNRRGR